MKGYAFLNYLGHVPGLPQKCTPMVRVAYLNLAFGHSEGVGEPCSFWSREVLGLFEGLFKGKDLMPGKRWSRVFLLFQVFGIVHVEHR